MTDNDDLYNAFKTFVAHRNIESRDASVLANFLFKHNCLYLLARLSSYRSMCESNVIINKLTSRIKYRECQSVFQQLEKTPYSVIKGAVLGERIYGDSGYRPYKDIDLLIEPNCIEPVKEILERNGFIQGRIIGNKIIPYTRQQIVFQKAYTHQLAQYVKRTDSNICPFVTVDINTDIRWGESPVKTNMKQFLTNAEETFSENVSIKTLPPEEEFISLCMHHYKDMNSIYILKNKGLYLSHFCDIYYYLENKTLDFSILKEKSQYYSVSEYVYFCVYHACSLFSSHEYDSLLNILRTESSGRLLDRFGLTETEYHRWEKPLTDYVFDSEIFGFLDSVLSKQEKDKISLNELMM